MKFQILLVKLNRSLKATRKKRVTTDSFNSLYDAREIIFNAFKSKIFEIKPTFSNTPQLINLKNLKKHISIGS